jgi:metal-responsive CopG/Arc/MetJ family transcriptional regulator
MNYAQVVEICCRDLRRYLEYALKNAKGGVVTVKMKRLLRAELSLSDRARYARCLSNILHTYRWKSDTYIISRENVEKLLGSFDALCELAKQVKSAERSREPKRPKEKLVLIAVSLPNELLRAVDAYAQYMNMSRSDVVRQAIQQLIELRKALEELDKARDGPLERVSLHLPRDLLTALDEYAASLKATRAALVRYAVYRLIEKIKEPAET